VIAAHGISLWLTLEEDVGPKSLKLKSTSL